MAYDEGLAERVRNHLAGVDGVCEKEMFGGVGFMVNGNMACGPNGEFLIVRVGPDVYQEALELPGADEMKFTGRPMKGWVQVEIDQLEDDKVLAEWIDRGLEFADSLPPK